MTYEIVEFRKGISGDRYDTLREAKKALAERIEKKKALNVALGEQESGTAGESFFVILDQHGPI